MMVNKDEYSRLDYFIFITRQYTDVRYWNRNSVCLLVCYAGGIASIRLHTSNFFVFFTTW